VKHVRFLPIPYKTLDDIKNRFKDKDPRIVEESKKYGFSYFDGDRKYGYGGYYYDGRWVSIAKAMVEHYDLKPGMRILDVGCAKGFLVKDFMIVCPGLEAFGLDTSSYALLHCEDEVIGRLHLGSADSLPFPDNSFDFVVSLNTLHNFNRKNVVKAFSEIERVSKGSSFIQVDSYETPEEKEIFEEWVLTAEYHGYPEDWLEVFKESGYTGDYDWTIMKLKK